MTARDDYPILTAWLGGMEMTGFNGDAMEVEVARALNEIDSLRAVAVMRIEGGWPHINIDLEQVKEHRDRKENSDG